MRLDLIRTLQEHGYTLSAIQRVLARIPEDATPAEYAVQAPSSHRGCRTRPRSSTAPALERRVGRPDRRRPARLPGRGRRARAARRRPVPQRRRRCSGTPSSCCALPVPPRGAARLGRDHRRARDRRGRRADRAVRPRRSGARTSAASSTTSRSSRSWTGCARWRCRGWSAPSRGPPTTPRAAASRRGCEPRAAAGRAQDRAARHGRRVQSLAGSGVGVVGRCTPPAAPWRSARTAAGR